MKKKTILLRKVLPGYNADEPFDQWRVVKVTNSTDYGPSDLLIKKQVDELCAAKDWDVTIISMTQ